MTKPTAPDSIVIADIAGKGFKKRVQIRTPASVGISIKPTLAILKSPSGKTQQVTVQAVQTVPTPKIKVPPVSFLKKLNPLNRAKQKAEDAKKLAAKKAQAAKQLAAAKKAANDKLAKQKADLAKKAAAAKANAAKKAAAAKAAAAKATATKKLSDAKKAAAAASAKKLADAKAAAAKKASLAKKAVTVKTAIIKKPNQPAKKVVIATSKPLPKAPVKALVKSAGKAPQAVTIKGSPLPPGVKSPGYVTHTMVPTPKNTPGLLNKPVSTPLLTASLVGGALWLFGLI